MLFKKKNKQSIYITLKLIRFLNFKNINKNFYHLLLSKPHRQLHYNFSNLNNPIGVNLSTGFLVKSEFEKFKYIKRSKRFITIILLILKVKCKKIFKNLSYLTVKNYSQLQYIWLKKFIQLVKPQLKFILFSQSYIISLKNKKRIKKRVFNSINKI